MRRAILAAAVAIGCGPKLQTAEDEPISAAWLEYFDLSSIAMLGGAAEGDAFLGYTTAAGEQKSLPVHLGGPVIGMAFDMTVDPEWGPSVPLDFTEAEVDPVMLSDALGTYKGSAVSFVMGGGIDSRVLENRHGIRLEEDHLAFGVGIMAGFQWIRIREGGSEQGEEEGTFDDTSTSPDDSGRTDDTAIADDTGASDDTAIADDTGASDDTAIVADDSATADDTGGDSGNHQAPPPHRQQKDGCGRDDSGSTNDDDNSDGGCCCGASNSAFIVGVWLMMGGRRRRHRD